MSLSPFIKSNRKNIGNERVVFKRGRCGPKSLSDAKGYLYPVHWTSLLQQRVFHLVNPSGRQDYQVPSAGCLAVRRAGSFSDLAEVTASPLDLRTPGNGFGRVVDH